MISALRGGFRAAVLMGAAMTGSQAASETSYRMMDFAELDGWAKDNHAAALKVFLETCMDLDDQDWQSLCAMAQHQDAAGARQFFELFFRPVLIAGESGTGSPYPMVVSVIATIHALSSQPHPSITR